MTFIEKIENGYLNVNGVVQPAPVPRDDTGSCDNLIFTAEAVITLWRIGSLTVDLKRRFARTVRLFLQDGLLLRPDFEGQQQQDDYLTVPCLAALCDPSIALAIYRRGQKKVKAWGPISLRYVYNNSDPEKWDAKAWMARNPAFVPNLKFCTEDTRLWPSIWEQMKWAASIIYGAYFYPEPRQPGGQDYWTIPWCMVMVNGGRTPITRFAAKIFWKQCRKVWPNGMRECLNIYFNLGSIEHPIAAWIDSSATER